MKNIQIKISKVKEDFLKAFFACDDPTPYLQQKVDNWVDNLIENKYREEKTTDEMAVDITEKLNKK